MKLKNRLAAGNLLGDLLKNELKKIKTNRNDNNVKRRPIVVGIPAGGVITALAVAMRLSAEFSIVIPRRLLAPHNHEIGIGSVMDDGELYLNQDIIEALNISVEYIENERSRQMTEIKSQTHRFQLKSENCFKDRTIVLIDDGAATGATLIAAIRYVRKRKPRYVIVGVPVAPKETICLLKREADIVKSIITPRAEGFKSVEQYYDDFHPVTVNQVLEALETSKSSISWYGLKTGDPL